MSFRTGRSKVLREHLDVSTDGTSYLSGGINEVDGLRGVEMIQEWLQEADEIAIPHHSPLRRGGKGWDFDMESIALIRRGNGGREQLSPSYFMTTCTAPDSGPFYWSEARRRVGVKRWPNRL